MDEYIDHIRCVLEPLENKTCMLIRKKESLGCIKNVEIDQFLKNSKVKISME